MIQTLFVCYHDCVTIFIYYSGFERNLTLFNCGNENFGHNFLDASTGSWPKDLFCMAYDDGLGANTTGSYSISADLYNYGSVKGAGFVHLGLAYNIMDIWTYGVEYMKESI